MAIKHKKHVDTVLAYRQRYLEDFDRKETIQKFITQAAEVRLNEYFTQLTYTTFLPYLLGTSSVVLITASKEGGGLKQGQELKEEGEVKNKRRKSVDGGLYNFARIFVGFRSESQ